MMQHVPPTGVVTFADGLPGFEHSRQFVLLASPAIAPFTLVQGMDGAEPSFVAIDPNRIASDFATALSDADLARLGTSPGRPLLWLALVTAGDERSATVNLRAPLVISPESMRGIQMIPVESPYRIDHPLPAV